MHSASQMFWRGCSKLSVPAIHLNEDACLKSFQGGNIFPRKNLPVCHSSDHQKSFPINAWSATFLLHLCLLVLRLGEKVIYVFSVEALFTWSLFMPLPLLNSFYANFCSAIPILPDLCTITLLLSCLSPNTAYLFRSAVPKTGPGILPEVLPVLSRRYKPTKIYSHSYTPG